MLLNRTNTVDYAMDNQGALIKSVVVPVPESEISGTGTPGPDFWSWEPPQGSDKGSDDKERSVDYLSIPLESKLQEPNRNPPLPPFQSLMEVEKVDVSEALSVKEEHELGDEFSAHAAEAAQTLDAVDGASSYGVNADGSKWWKESGIKQRPDGMICKWTRTIGVSADQVTEWQDNYREAAYEFGHKELGSEKLGRDATGNVWREFLDEVYVAVKLRKGLRRPRKEEVWFWRGFAIYDCDCAKAFHSD
ncbi:hypothetical protein ACFX2A_010110 [Malus domestica]